MLFFMHTMISRSELMSRIRSKGNKETELKLAGLFHKHRVTGWRRNATMFGKPDFLCRKERVAVFVDGCFWHGCPVHGRIPKTNKKFWREKIARNMKRDRKVSRTLRSRGWHVVRIWEHALCQKSELATIRRITRILGRGDLENARDRF
jgi:DNA mismatch endonuclease (patch repair protein)